MLFFISFFFDKKCILLFCFVAVFCCLRLRVRVRVRVRGSERPSTVNSLRREKERKGMTFAAG